MSFKIGIITNSLKLPLQVAIKKAKEMGVDGVQIHSVSGEASVDVLNAEARKKLKKFIASLDLEISAICGDLGGHGYSCENENHEKKKNISIKANSRFGSRSRNQNCNYTHRCSS